MNEQAIKARVERAAKKLGIRFNQAWHKLVLERFLVRLSKPSHRDKFIFKGGALLAHYIDLKRETRDLDFLITKIQGERSVIERALIEIIAQNIGDGFRVELKSIDNLPHDHMKYPGFTATFISYFVKIKQQFEIDIGVGDVVIPVEESLPLLAETKGPVFEDSASLLAYPPETIFAEKLEAAVFRGAVNSRMKDYHDMLALIESRILSNKEKVSASITSTFKNRETKLTLPPIQLEDSEIVNLQKYWTEYLSRRKDVSLPKEIKIAIETINKWTLEILA